jgi:hypothetical protein
MFQSPRRGEAEKYKVAVDLKLELAPKPTIYSPMTDRYRLDTGIKGLDIQL